MKNFTKLIFICSSILWACTSNQIYSSEQKQIDIKSNILISNAIEEKEVKTVTASGFGTTLESAAQNAAENALTQVVGSFIDAETQIKKQKEIRDGVISKTKIIKKDIKDYSQGSIKYFEILNVQQNGSIFNVSARVDVRIDDFRAYIKQLALKSKEISTTNLFAEMGAKKDNLENKFELFKNIITPIYEGEVIDIEIGELSSLDALINSKDCLIHLDESYCDPNSSRFYQDLNVENSVFFPFNLKIKRDFYTNSINTLNNISDLKTSSITSISGKDAFNTIGNNPPYYFNNSQDLGVIFRNHKNQTNSQYFILKDIGARTSGNSSSRKLNRKYTYNYNRDASKLRISLIDSKGETLYSFEEDCSNRDPEKVFKGELKSVALLSKLFRNNYVGYVNRCPSQLYQANNYYSSITFDITGQKYFGFAFEVDDLERLKDFKEIKIEYLQK